MLVYDTEFRRGHLFIFADGFRQCMECLEWKMPEQFRRTRKGHDNPNCVECTGDSPKHDDRLRKYGLTKDQFEALLQRQGGTCAIPGCTETGVETRAGKRMLHVDHDHACCPAGRSCGKCIRGLLCFRHNTGLGKFGDSVEGLLNALEYLLNPPFQSS